MKPKIVLFDLDGTLLPMDQDVFVKVYFGDLANKLAPYGYDAGLLVKGIWSGIAAMVRNDGSCTNEAAFWDCFAAVLGAHVREDLPLFEEFYRVEFQRSKDVCGYNPLAAQTVAQLKTMGLRVALATNPIFPDIATQSRIRWAGLEPEDFELYTTYETSHYCKPNPAYYKEILEKLDLRPEDCLMVGNDAVEDTAAEDAGIPVFLLTDCLINTTGKDISAYPQGSFPELMAYIERL